MLRKIKGFGALAVLLLPMSLSAQTGLDTTQFGIRPGDEVSIRVFTAEGVQVEEISGARIVDSQGEIYLPYIGSVDVTGMSATDIRNRLAEEYSRLYDSPVVEVTSRLKVNVTGAVRVPGHYLLDPSSTLIDALAEAGGIASDIDIGYQAASDAARARLVRGGQISILDLRPETNDPEVFNLPVQSGDWIHIPIQERSRIREQVQFWSQVLSLAISALTLIVLAGN